MTLIESATEAFLQGNFELVASLLGDRLLSPDPDPEELLLLGVALTRLGRSGAAAEAIAKVITLEPNSFEAHGLMAVLLKGKGETGEAIESAATAVRLNPDEASAHSTLADCYLADRQLGPAIASYLAAIRILPGIAQFHHGLGVAYSLSNEAEKAITHLRKAIHLSPSEPSSYLALADALVKLGRIPGATAVLKQALTRTPRSPELTIELANALSQTRDPATEHTYLQAISLSTAARASYASWLQDEGRFEEAAAQYHTMIQEVPFQGLAYHGLTQIKKTTDEDRPVVERMQAIAEDPRLESSQRLVLLYALGRAQEHLGDYGAAMAYWDRANDLAFQTYNRWIPFSQTKTRADNNLALQKLSRLSGQGSASEAPIFIVGMIRSGTTLLEQIVSNHPMVKACGELRFWLDEGVNLLSHPSISEADLRSAAKRYLDQAGKLSPGQIRFTDKMPLNFLYLGLIHQAFPNARIIHVRRNPIDTCISIYSTHFGAGPQFVYSKANIAFYYREYLRVVNVWRNLIPQDRFLEVDYETLTSDPEATIQSIVSFCGLPWDEACLHPERNHTSVNTPSRWQARQPIYRTSTGKWRRFEPWLEELAEVIEP